MWLWKWRRRGSKDGQVVELSGSGEPLHGAEGGRRENPQGCLGFFAGDNLVNEITMN